MSEQNIEGKIDKVLMEHAAAGKLPCKIALKIAENLKVLPKMVGDSANRLKIKIISCQLGCFK